MDQNTLIVAFYVSDLSLLLRSHWAFQKALSDRASPPKVFSSVKQLRDQDPMSLYWLQSLGYWNPGNRRFQLPYLFLDLWSVHYQLILHRIVRYQPFGGQIAAVALQRLSRN